MQDAVIRASQLLPHHMLARASTQATARAIARDARRRLGRRASRSPNWLDVGAITAIVAAAGLHGVPTQIAGWAWCGATLHQMARSLVFRAIESGVWMPKSG